MSPTFINIHTHRKSQITGETSIVNLFPEDVRDTILAEGVWYSAGLHPRNIPEKTFEQEMEVISAAMENESVIAAGEAGIDRLCEIPLNLQELVFNLHLDLAEKHSKPVIIHCVRAWNDLLRIRKTRTAVPWIFHGFSGKPEIAMQLIRHGCFLSFGKALLKPNSVVGTLLQRLAFQNIFFETDDEDIPVSDIYKHAAKLLSCETEELLHETELNFISCFGKNAIQKT
jgi:TatD DNase family protein